MIYVSFVEILSKANSSLSEFMGEVKGGWVTIASFFGGILFIALIDRLIPSVENPHEIKKVEDMENEELRYQTDENGLIYSPRYRNS